MGSPYSIAISPPRSLFDGHGRKLIASGIPIVKLQISCKCTSYSSAGSGALLKSTSEIVLWRLNMLLKESVDTEN